jgi:hypothetical protein
MATFIAQFQEPVLPQADIDGIVAGTATATRTKEQGDQDSPAWAAATESVTCTERESTDADYHEESQYFALPH